ncbi:MAG: TlpA disulfide reductase family protein [Opitutaceae bacterium]
MKAAHVLLAVALSFSVTCGLQAQSPDRKKGAPKSEADVAFEQIGKLRDAATAKPDPANFQKLLVAGFDFLAKQPKHPRVGLVVDTLGKFGATLRDSKEKNQSAQRASWVASLKYEIVSRKFDETLSEDTRAAISALDAAVANFDVIAQPNKPNLATFREKIDALAQVPGGTRFLADQELAYLSSMDRIDPKGVDAHLRTLAQHSDPAVAKMAREQINITEATKAPYVLKFTGLDGKEFDFEKTRGKVVALVFWAASNERSPQMMTALKATHTNFAKKFEVVTVSYDKAEDREKLVKFVKDNKVTWPVYFDGTEAKNEFGQKLNVQRAPAVVLFDQKGMLANPAVRADRVDAEVRRMLGVKEEAPSEPMPDMGGGG